MESLREKELALEIEKLKATAAEALDGWNESSALLEKALLERDKARAERDELDERITEIVG